MLCRLKNKILNWFCSFFDQKLFFMKCCKKTKRNFNQGKIPDELISHNALKVLQRLHDSGYEAYLVGGCIRDILLQIRPKDFDIATNAHPEQVRKLFRNSRIIGRRFKLIHIIFGREIIEVATFRACHRKQNHQNHMVQDSNSGRILRDNVYGTIQDDAARRDFTINALYYRHVGDQQKILDFSSGIKDLQRKKLRLLGDPEVRYREDPVRMLRAIRFAAKLNFNLAKTTAAPIRQLIFLLNDVPAARLFDEVLKLFLNGHGLQSWHLLQTYELFACLFPDAALIMTQKKPAKLLFQETLRNTDERVHNELPVTPAFLYAALLWHCVLQTAKRLQDSENISARIAMQKSFDEVIKKQCRIITIPKRFTIATCEIWDLQHALVRRHPEKITNIAAHPRFRAAYDLLIMREKSGESLNNAGKWWMEYQKKNPVKRRSFTRRNSSENSFKKQR